MASPYQRRRPSPLAGLLMPGGVVLAVLLVLGGLYATGILHLGAKKRPFVRPAGTVPVVLSPREIPANTRITRDLLWDPRSGGFKIIYIPEAQVTSDMLTTLNKLVGRVLNHDKPAQYAFSEDDFYPLHTREGIVGAIPPGKRALRLEAHKLAGIYGLHEGDHFDICSSIPVDTNLKVGGTYKDYLALQSAVNQLQKQASVRFIVQNGTVVQPVSIRQEPITSASLLNGQRTRMKPVQEVVIAVAPEEVGPLTAALAVDATITCVPRSGRPEDDPASLTPDLKPLTPFSAGASEDPSASPLLRPLKPVETFNGDKRAIEAVPEAEKK